MFGKSSHNSSAPGGVLDNGANALAAHLINAGIEGVGPFKSAAEVARKALEKNPSKEKAIEAVIAEHTRLAGANGVLTNLGGFITVPVALPANIVGFYTVATRMVAAIAAIDDFDLQDPAVRSAVLLDLIGTDATSVLKGMGAFSGGVATNVATRRLPPAALAVVNKSVAFRIGSQFGKRALTRLPRMIPLAGGVIGGGLDVLLIRKIAESARKDFATKVSATKE